jgi:hypothetical protein
MLKVVRSIQQDRHSDSNSFTQPDQYAGDTGKDAGQSCVRKKEHVRQLDSMPACYLPEDRRVGIRVGAVNSLGLTGYLHSNEARTAGNHCRASCEKRHSMLAQVLPVLPEGGSTQQL